MRLKILYCFMYLFVEIRCVNLYLSKLEETDKHNGQVESSSIG